MNNDMRKPITAEDLIRMYNLNDLKTDRRQINTLRVTLHRQNTIARDFVAYTTIYKTQEDKLTVWFDNGIPEVTEDYLIGDLLYDRETGNAYQLKEEGWEQLNDLNLIKSLALANSEADTSDGKRVIYYVQPYTPYVVGDVWLNGNLIMRCRSARSDGNFEEVDWVTQDNYSNEFVLRDTRALLDDFKITVERDYVTKVLLETSIDSITASVEAITTEIITTATEKYEYYDDQLAQIKVSVGDIELLVQTNQSTTDNKFAEMSSKIELTEKNITQEVSEYKQAIDSELVDIDSKITQTASEINQTITDNVNDINSTITQKVDSLTTEINKKVNTDTFNSRISQTESSISSKVSKNEFGSYVEQYYDKFLVGFNDSSRYIQMDTNGIKLYNGTISSSSLLMELNRYGISIYEDNYHVGNITSAYYASDNSQKGLSFQLDSGGRYMGWFQRSSSSGSYYATLYYARANSFGQTNEGIHFSSNVYGHGYSLSGFNMANATANLYETADNKSIPIVTNIDVDEDGNLIVEKSAIDVRSGMITSVPNNSEEIKEV